MSTDTIADEAICSFRDWVINQTNRDVWSRDDQPDCLADFIEAWVRSGVGVRVCVGDFQTYLIGVIAIIDYWQRDEQPDLLDYVGWEDDPNDPSVERRVSKILRNPTPVYGDILDPHWFATCTFQTLHPYASDLPDKG